MNGYEIKVIGAKYIIEPSIQKHQREFGMRDFDNHVFQNRYQPSHSKNNQKVIIPDYSNFSLKITNFNSHKTLIKVFFNNFEFHGQWEIQGNSQIIIDSSQKTWEKFNPSGLNRILIDFIPWITPKPVNMEWDGLRTTDTNKTLSNKGYFSPSNKVTKIINVEGENEWSLRIDRK